LLKVEKHKHHAYIKDLKKRFYLSLILTIPILLLSETIQSWANFKLEIPFQKEVLLLLSTILKGYIKELKMRKPGMVTLIASAITVDFLNSKP